MFSKTFLLLDILFMLILIICSIIDIKKRIVPNTCIVLLLVIGIAKVILDNIACYPWWMHITGLVYTIPFFITWNKNQMGAGDVKIIVAISLFLGLFNSLISFCFMIAALLLYVMFAWIKKKDLKQSIPLAPFISIGFLGFITLKHFLLLI